MVSMDDGNGNGLHDLHLASRKAEEAEDTSQIDFQFNLLWVASQIVERQHLPSESVTWDSNALPAYQYFENVKNFLAAVERLKIPSFQASDLERDGFQSGSVCRVVDCILSLKAYHELKEYYRGSGILPKPLKSPLVLHSASKKFSGISNANHASPCRRLELSIADDKNSVEDAIAKGLVDRMLETKENINYSLLTSLRNKDLDPVNKFRKILIDCLEGQLQINIPELNLSSNNGLKEESCTVAQSPPVLKDLPTTTKAKEIKVSLSIAKKDFEELNIQFFCDLKHIEKLVEEMSTAAQGYQKVIKENRNLYNTVQDLKGEDGSLVLVDPSKPRNRRQVFQFNQVYGPMASQDELLRDIRPLIRSVMDGYNVCVFAYGQTGSGKTYSMSGLSDGSVEAKGMNHLVLNDLFHLSTQRKNLVNYRIHVEMVEIYNEQVRDLLAQELSSKTSESGGHANGDVLDIPEVTLHSVTSIEDANNLIKRGAHNRTIGSAEMNITRSDRLDESDISRDGLQKAQVDKSLSCFQDVITALSQKSSYIPYRNSKLTLLLKDALGGSAKTLMFAHISPEADNLEATLETLKFAQKLLFLQIENLKKALINKEAQSVHSIRRPTSPYEKPKATCDKTPQPRRSRRLSIENQSATKFQTTPNTVGNKSRDPKSPTQRGVRRSRRLSIENTVKGVKPVNMEPDKNKERKSPYKHSAMKSEKTMLEKTLPPRSRRLSIETPSSIRPVTVRAQNSQSCKVQKSPYGGVKQGRIDRTPTRSQRHGNENSSTVKSSKETRGKLNKTPLSTAQHGAVRASTRARRLSLEGPIINPNMDPSMEFIEVELNTSMAEVSSVSFSTPCLSIPDSMPELSHEETVNGISPSSYQEAASSTPDRQILGRKEAQLNTDNRSLEYQTPIALTNARVKESQIKKSLRSIGKLINGSDKRNHCNTEAATKGKNFKVQAELSVPSNSRTLRRQSLTGTQPASRRSSLAGNTTDTDYNCDQPQE
ncbi:hypothetical protein V2J09_023955 [Rumex salicifolius]